jgi:hypothetical protein
LKKEDFYHKMKEEAQDEEKEAAELLHVTFQ